MKKGIEMLKSDPWAAFHAFESKKVLESDLCIVDRDVSKDGIVGERKYQKEIHPTMLPHHPQGLSQANGERGGSRGYRKRSRYWTER